MPWARRTGQALSAAFGVLCAIWLWQALHVTRLAFEPVRPRAAVKVRTAQAAPPAAAAPAVPSTILPLRADTSSVRKSKPAPAVSAPSKPAEPAATPQVTQTAETVAPVDDLPTIEQPRPYLGPSQAHRDLPVIDGAGAPPLPGDPGPQVFSLVTTERPGGQILVLGVLVDDKGIALDAKVLVHSQFPLGDISAAMTNVGKQWLDLNPPMAPGEQRWLELRIDYGHVNPTYDPIP